MATKLSVNPWRSIWTQPRETIRKIVSTNASYRLLPLYMIYGFPICLHIAQFFGLGSSLAAGFVLLIALVVSPLAGFIGISFWSILLFWTGQWIKGRAPYKNIRAAIAWTNVPNIVTDLTWVLLGLIIGTALFVPGFGMGEMTMAESRLVLGLSIVQVLASIWAFVIFIVALSEVQGFSILKAIANVIIPCAILFVLGGILNSIMLRMQS